MMPRVAVGLNWLGRQARYILAIGCVAAFFMPSLSAFLRPALPFFRLDGSGQCSGAP